MYKFDTHVHTSETSPCGNISAHDTVDMYIKAGFSGICITDHYNKSYFNTWKCDSWNETIDRLLKGYYNAKLYGDNIGFNVLLGVELRLEDNLNEYLLYGVTEQFLYHNPKLYEYKINVLKLISNKNNILIFQAHPFRPNLTPENPKYLDGVEVINGNKRHNSRNELAIEFAEKNNLLMSAGSDCHEVEDVGRSGIITNKRIEEAGTLVEILKSKNFKLINVC
jgi:histidinol phosphatase-like PHP family hydrolase